MDISILPTYDTHTDIVGSQSYAREVYSYQCYEPLSEATEYLALRIEASAKVDGAVDKGWTDERCLRRATPTLTAMSHALREWSQHSDGFFASAWCEVIGYKI
ncbi:hypothetical protein [Nostoc sp. NZL]|uniref:hypothetical protein n=1 Tax=Nostoc sp. NZL TaxID=2650612 RepID=UPI0018C5F960|nr:hypothetical protein [Nostoc sp. NZL]MBG1239981.1 hypothetical protein [Nostoc sp. NZL]